MNHFFPMDARVKPAHDESRTTVAGPRPVPTSSARRRRLRTRVPQPAPSAILFRRGSRRPRTIRIRQHASVTTAEPAIAVARDEVIDRVADHPWDKVEAPCPLPARKLAGDAQRGFGFYIGSAGRHERKGIRAIRI